ncbi:MAG: DnaJ domain-containing protein, partial [Vulcanimicrobiaceae bacterium]
MQYKDYYEVLGVPKNAPEKDIKSAFRKLARKWHPDQNPTNQKAAEERFKEINEAYEVLGDGAKRKKYDALGSDWSRAAQQAEAQRRYRTTQGFDASSFGAHPGGEPPTDFSEFFNMFFGATGGPQGSRRSRSASTARRGEDLETTLELPLADAFRGGKKTVTLQFEDVCPKCGGSGIVGQEICPVCGGTGRTLSAKTFDVTIPRGVRSGQRI